MNPFWPCSRRPFFPWGRRLQQSAWLMNKLNLRYAEQQNTATAYHTPILMTSCFVYEPFQSFDNLLSFLKIECEAEEQITNQIMIMSSLHILIDIKEVAKQTLAFPYFTQRIPILAPSLVPITLTRSGLENCWIISATEDFKKTQFRQRKLCRG